MDELSADTGIDDHDLAAQLPQPLPNELVLEALGVERPQQHDGGHQASTIRCRGAGDWPGDAKRSANAWVRGTRRPTVRHRRGRRDLVFDWGTIKWLSEVRITGSGIAAGVVILEPGKGHTRHNHPGFRGGPVLHLG